MKGSGLRNYIHTTKCKRPEDDWSSNTMGESVMEEEF